jgi:hypothetical protein
VLLHARIIVLVNCNETNVKDSYGWLFPELRIIKNCITNSGKGSATAYTAPTSMKDLSHLVVNRIIKSGVGQLHLAEFYFWGLFNKI